ncbi:MAG: hypothetical protein AAGE52_12250 [Myxococcota bacterium]
MKAGTLAFLTFALLACGSPTTGSETHWLRQCETDDECGSLLCECGICTRLCDDTPACDGLGVCGVDGSPSYRDYCRDNGEEAGICVPEEAPDEGVCCAPSSPCGANLTAGGWSPTEAGCVDIRNPGFDGRFTLSVDWHGCPFWQANGFCGGTDMCCLTVEPGACAAVTDEQTCIDASCTWTGSACME